jgi:hypothetical protein
MARKEQQEWFSKLEETAMKGKEIYNISGEEFQKWVWDEFRDRVRTEEIKAWYSEPERNSLFQGTSVSSLTIPYETSNPLRFDSMNQLEDYIADAYIELHDKYAGTVKEAMLENVDDWIMEGLYYGVVVCSKVISQALGLYISSDDVIFEVNGHRVDPHEITSYPMEVRDKYFEKCRKKIKCFDGIDIEQKELESSLVLSDISKPKLIEYNGKIILAPIRCNEIASLLSEGVTKKIVEKTGGRIRPRSISVVIYDTDTPYTYHRIMRYNARTLSPVLPGLTILGSSGTIDAFKWLYAYRVSLIAQKMQKGSLYSQVHGRFVPFIFFGVLVPRDAEILLDMDNLHRLRYRGNFSPCLEFTYLISDFHKYWTETPSSFSWEDFRKKHFV